MPNKNFRENKYLNESGSKKGNWYLNRLDFFQFHEYPAYKKHKFFSLVAGLILGYLSIKVMLSSFLVALPILYLSYVALTTFRILHEKVCPYNGYLFYPKKFIKFYRAREVEVDINDFDSIATMSKK